MLVEEKHLDRQPPRSFKKNWVEVEVGYRHDLLIGGGCRSRNMDERLQNRVPDGEAQILRAPKTCS